MLPRALISSNRRFLDRVHLRAAGPGLYPGLGPPLCPEQETRRVVTEPPAGPLASRRDQLRQSSELAELREASLGVRLAAKKSGTSLGTFSLGVAGGQA